MSKDCSSLVSETNIPRRILLVKIIQRISNNNLGYKLEQN
jgi:hypothetical protein